MSTTADFVWVQQKPVVIREILKKSLMNTAQKQNTVKKQIVGWWIHRYGTREFFVPVISPEAPHKMFTAAIPGSASKHSKEQLA